MQTASEIRRGGSLVTMVVSEWEELMRVGMQRGGRVRKLSFPNECGQEVSDRCMSNVKSGAGAEGNEGVAELVCESWIVSQVG